MEASKGQLDHNIPMVAASQNKGRCVHKAIPLDFKQLRNIPSSKEWR